jgi:hypothetical protein
MTSPVLSTLKVGEIRTAEIWTPDKINLIECPTFFRKALSGRARTRIIDETGRER